MKTTDYLKEVQGIVEELEKLHFKPILVGGMALVILGSQRVTQDFDFLISHPGDKLETLVEVFYRRGMQLASRVSKVGEIIGTIDSQRVAAIRLRIDAPSSVYFFNPKTGLRIDLLFDFPMTAKKLEENARKMKIDSSTFYIASEEDLLQLKEMAASARNSPSDLQDLDFLKKRKK
ncbi:MAG: hypothetical protein HY540_05300 [Deltaproteobacteria bacterium]|nr:hypothetical protein [Deltaproteobacteria bacterium]